MMPRTPTIVAVIPTRALSSLRALLSTGLNCTFSLRRLSPELTSVTPSKLRSSRRALAEPAVALDPVVALGEAGGAGDASPAAADSRAAPAAFGPERSTANAGEKQQQRQAATARTLSAHFRRGYGGKAIAVSTVGNAHDDWSRIRLSASRGGLPSLVYPRGQVWEGWRARSVWGPGVSVCRHGSIRKFFYYR